MRKLSKVTFLFAAVVMIMQVLLPTVSMAILVADDYTQEQKEVYLDIQNARPYNDDDGDTIIGNDEYGFYANDADQTVFKIGEKSGGTINFNKLYYCLKWGIGFGTEYVVPDEGVLYSYVGNLSDGDYGITNSNAIRWIADNMYVPNAQDANVIKQQLLTKAGITESELTDDDIDVIQQFAIWYFITDQYDLQYKMHLENFDLGKAMLNINGAMFSDSASDRFTAERAEQINQLFEYFTNNVSNTLEETSVEFDDSVARDIVETTIGTEDVTKIGPFKIDANNDNYYNFSYDLKYKDSVDGEWQALNTNYYVLDGSHNVLTTEVENYDLENEINNGEFYIVILKDDIEDITNFKIELDYSYNNTVATVWSAGNYSQPVLRVEKVKVSPSDEIEAAKYIAPKEFDLSLRKFISAIRRNGNDIQIESREPIIDTTTLREGALNEDRNEIEYTATYTHPKNTIRVKRGDTVTYTIRVYNEGEIDGQATEVTDYLPEGLVLVPKAESTINTKYDWELQADESVKTSYLTDKDIPAYEGIAGRGERANGEIKWQQAENSADGLYYIDLQIECTIDDNVTTGAVIPNIAEITADNSGYSVDDRDSNPDNVDIPNYEFRINNEGYSNNSMYQQDDDDFERLIVEERDVFDLSLRKYITKIERDNGEGTSTVAFDSREPMVSGIANLGTENTAIYRHRKNPLEVQEGDIVTYAITVYNEGNQSGRAKAIIDQLPDGLEFQDIVSEGETSNYTASYDRSSNTVTFTEIEANNNNLPGREETRLHSTTIYIRCKVVANEKKVDQVLTNIAWISLEYNYDTNTEIEREEGLDRDSEPGTAPSGFSAEDLNTADVGYTGKETYSTEEELANSSKYYEGEQDDDDFEKIVIRGKLYFDLSLRKYISNIERNGTNVDFESRVPEVNTSSLQDGTTSNYVHPKNTLTVKQGDIVTYKIRVYNEGDIDGYATEITDYLPAGLGFLDGYSKNYNNTWSFAEQDVESRPLVGEENGWYKDEASVPTDGVFENEDLDNITIVSGKNNAKLELTTEALKNKLINKYTEGSAYLDYEEIEITCIVIAPNTFTNSLVNIAEISKDKAVEEIEGIEIELSVNDRDSQVGNVLEDGTHTPGTEVNGYTPGEQDDDDFEPIQLKYFDLALRKFITGVNDKAVNSRIPEFYIDESGNYKYRHSKTPVEVVDKDIVTYTIRVFNEGTMEGYANEVEDDIPEGLVFLPDESLNKTFRWKMYYRNDDGNLVETDDAAKAKVIRTDYLSQEQEALTGRENIISPFDKVSMTSPAFKDIKVQFKVLQAEIPEDNEERIIINKAHITKDSDDDEDSTPDEWIETDDDQDIEKVYVQEFDLALYKWVTKTIVTVDGKTTETETGFKPNIGHTEGTGENYRTNSEVEPIAQVSVSKKKLKSTVVKFEYNIKVVNEGDIAGYATEITDYIPEGLEFIAEDNPLWTIGEKDGTIASRTLETVLLEPGKSVTIPVVFTWINDADNLGQKTNIAAITEDYNDKKVPDIDSVPGNEDIAKYEKEQEDDDDFALVILSLETGGKLEYFGLMLGFITVIAVGIILIRKYVL